MGLGLAFYRIDDDDLGRPAETIVDAAADIPEGLTEPQEGETLAEYAARSKADHSDGWPIEKYLDVADGWNRGGYNGFSP